MKIIVNEYTISLAFIVLAVLFLDPFMLLMPDSAVYVLVAGLVVFFAGFAAFVWRERVRDERDDLHRMLAGRIGYLAGAAGLAIGIAVQALTATVDPWLVAGLTLMVVGKLAGLVYSRAHR